MSKEKPLREITGLEITKALESVHGLRQIFNLWSLENGSENGWGIERIREIWRCLSHLEKELREIDPVDREPISKEAARITTTPNTGQRLKTNPPPGASE